MPDPDLTPAARARLWEICEAATPGPWRIMLDGLKHREPIAVVADDAELAARFPHDGEALRTHQIFLAHAAKDGDLAFAVAWNPETAKAALALIKQQQTTIDRLPKTRDGVPMFVGDTVWFYEPEIGIRPSCIEYMRPHASGTLTVYVDDGEVACLQTELYSTEQAATAAKERNSDAE